MGVPRMGSHATSINLIGDFSKWKVMRKYALRRIAVSDGVWEIKLPATALRNGDLYKMYVCWEGGGGERIPAYANRVVQDEQTHIFSAQVWCPEKPYKWKVKRFVPDTKPLLIYECHIGMSQEREGVGTYNEFRENVLPRVAADGYNAIQIMAIQEHPYYGSFGYHVSSFYAPSSRFGTPEELKALIDAAHEKGIAVIMDIVHSHAVKNEVEGLGRLDGSLTFTSMATTVANIPHGIRYVSIMAKIRCSTSCSPIANIGLRSSASMVSASME